MLFSKNMRGWKSKIANLPRNFNKFRFVGLLVIDMERASTFLSGKSEEHAYDGKDMSNLLGTDIVYLQMQSKQIFHAK